MSPRPPQVRCWRTCAAGCRHGGEDRAVELLTATPTTLARAIVSATEMPTLADRETRALDSRIPFA